MYPRSLHLPIFDMIDVRSSLVYSHNILVEIIVGYFIQGCSVHQADPAAALGSGSLGAK